MTDAAAALAEVRTQISDAARSVNRDPDSITLIAVSKTFGVDQIIPVIAAGQRVFGENRVQEAKGKWPELKAKYDDVEVHLIGPLQSNKTKEAVELFDAIHSIDRPKIAKAVAQEIERQGRQIELFVQVNTGEEEQKAGVAPKDVVEFVRYCRDDLKLPVAGLMCIPPVDEEPSVHFAFLAELAKRTGVIGLSMGMSSDFTAAVELGATHVRIGSAIFGARG